MRGVVLPVVTCLLLALAGPYAVAAGVTPLLGESSQVPVLCRPNNGLIIWQSGIAK